MRPFFTFFGGKWRAAPRYPAPTRGTIIEPFAGAAGYAVRHYEHDIILVEKDPEIAALWRYLIKADRAEIEALPLIEMDQSVDDLAVSPAARTLIGFWLNAGTSSACKTPSAWMRQGLRPKSYWGPEIRARIAGQVDRISHWRVIEGSYENAPDIDATWFIDPPYAGAGKHYRHGSRSIDFAALGEWCQERRGQIMVCENEGAGWLPFEPFIVIQSTMGSAERPGAAKPFGLGIVTLGANRIGMETPFVKAVEKLYAGGNVYIPADGLGTGLSRLPGKAPRILANIESIIASLDKFR